MSNTKLKSSAFVESPTRIPHEQLRISQYDRHSSPEIAPHLYIRGSTTKKRNLHTTPPPKASAGKLRPTPIDPSHGAPQKSQPLMHPHTSHQNSKYNSRPESPGPRPSKPKPHGSEQKPPNNTSTHPGGQGIRSAHKEIEVGATRPGEIRSSGNKNLSHSPLQSFGRGGGRVRAEGEVRGGQGVGVGGGGNPHPLSRSSSQLQVTRVSHHGNHGN